jgi:restriction endonuclease S subunit
MKDFAHMSHKTNTAATKEEAKPALVPKLRFPEFRGVEGWHVTSLDSVCEILNNRRRPITGNERTPGPYPYYGASGVVDYVGDFIFNERLLLIGEDGAKWGAFEKTAFIADGRYWVNNHAHVLKPIAASDTLLENYLTMLDLSPFVTGAAPPKLTLGKLKGIPVPLPPKSAEQQKIADCLSSLDELIAAQARKVDALKTHKKGLMQQLFPREGETQPRLRFPEFRDLRDWKVSSIQELIDQKFIVGHLDGNHGSLYPRSEEFSDAGVPYISAASFNNGGIDFDRCKFLPAERAAQFKKGIARDGDILFAHNATVGPVAKLTTKCDFVILSTSLTYFRCNRALLSSDFLQCALVSPVFVDQCARVMSQSTRNQIPITTQRTFSLQLPTLPEQIRIADCLTSLDATIAVATQELETLKVHKKGLMQQLFPAFALTS